MKRAKTLVSVAEHSVGSKEAPEAVRIELKNLLDDMDVYVSRLEGLLRNIEEKLKEIPYINKLLAIKGIGKNDEFRSIHEYYRTRKENPLKKMQSVVAVVCKILRVFYTILTKGVDYDPVKMMGDIRRPQIHEA